MDRPTPFLWLKSGAEEAAAFYVSLFPDSAVTASNAQVTSFTLKGVPWQLFNGGPYFSLSPAFSIQVLTEDQAETDRLWAALTRGGEESMCGWLIDRWGVSWQIAPRRFIELLNAPETAERARAAMMEMHKIDLAAIEAACR